MKYNAYLCSGLSFCGICTAEWYALILIEHNKALSAVVVTIHKIATAICVSSTYTREGTHKDLIQAQFGSRFNTTL